MQSSRTSTGIIPPYGLSLSLIHISSGPKKGKTPGPRKTAWPSAFSFFRALCQPSTKETSTSPLLQVTSNVFSPPSLESGKVLSPFFTLDVMAKPS